MATANSGATDVKRWIWALIGIGLFLLLWTMASLRIGNPVLLPQPQSVCLDSLNCCAKEACSATCSPACGGCSADLRSRPPSPCHSRF